jgi:ferrous-iron efflux pump FieF
MQVSKELYETQDISYTRLTLSFTLTLFKLLAGFLGNSTLLIVDSIRSFSEFLNEYIKILDIYIASKPGDKSHNYGHGKITTLCMGTGALILLIASFRAIFLSSEELFIFLQGKEPDLPKIIAFYAAIIAFVLNNAVNILAGKIEPPAKKALLQVHISTKDLLISGFVLFGTGCTFLPIKGFNITDSFAAFLLSFYILWTSGRLFYRNVNELIEASLEEENNLKIREIINKTENVTGSGELKTRRIGKGIAINACVYVNSSLNVCEAAEIANLVEESLKTAFSEEIYTLIKIEPSVKNNQFFKNNSIYLEEERSKRATSF